MTPTLAEIYMGLRGQVLGLAAVELEGLPAEAQLLAALMDMPVTDALATVVGVADGTTSIYFSTGGGILGAGEQERVRDATARWLAACVDAGEQFAPVVDPQLPEPGAIQFVLVTRVGLAHAVAREDELRTDHPLARVYAAAQDVITEVRLVEQAAAS